MKTIKFLTAIMLAASVSGCVATAQKNPLGVSDDDWAAMSDEMKLYAYERQAQLDAQRKADSLTQPGLVDQSQAISDSMSSDYFGQRVQCTLDGESRLGGKWRPTEPFGFDVSRGQTAEFSYYSGRHSNAGTATFDGVTVQACGTATLPSYCVRLAATAHQLDRGGVKQRVSSKDFFRGEMTCSLADRPTRR